MVLNPDQTKLLHRLMRVAAIDLGRAYSASWSRSRLRTLLIEECIKRDLQVLDASASVSASSNPRPRGGQNEPTAPDLAVLDRGGRKLLTLDVLCGSLQSEAGEFTPTAVYKAFARLNAGHIDAVIISADADIYSKLLEPDESMKGSDAPRIKVFTALLPPLGDVSMREPRRITIDDTTLTIFGARVMAFGIGRVVIGACQSP